MLDPHGIFNVRKHTQWQNRGRTNDKKGNARNPRLRAPNDQTQIFQHH